MTISVPATPYEPTPLPVRRLSAAEICAFALGKNGAFPTNDEAPDPDHMDRALGWLDMIVAELTGNRRCYWLSPATVTFDWPEGEQSVVLADALGADAPPTGILFPVRAWAVDTTTGMRRHQIELCRRKKYERHGNLATVGNPQLLFIDRLIDNSLAYIWPVPSTTNPWRIALEFQVYARSVLGEQGGDQAGDVPVGFDATWNLYLVTRLAAETGDGPVVKLDQGTIRDWRKDAAELLSNLLYHNREKNSKPYRTKRYGG